MTTLPCLSTSTSNDALLATSTTILRHHYNNVVMPLWQGPGFNSLLGLPFESVLPESVPAPLRYRAMACARQLFIFSEANDYARASILFKALVTYFLDAKDGGFFYSVDAAGHPLERTKDLYTHAFVIFACAAFFSNFKDSEARSRLFETQELIDTKFPIDAETGLSVAAASADFKEICATSRQNPLMHLTEAYLAAKLATNDASFDEHLYDLLPKISSVFVDKPSGCVMELPQLHTESWIEPGHQFEWFFLAQDHAHPAFHQCGLYNNLVAAFAFAEQHGVVPETGGVSASIDRQGKVLDKNQRIWAQTEYIRALASHPDKAKRDRLTAEIMHFRERFLHSRGWYECLDPNGVVLRHDMPSTTAYHLATAYAAL